MSINSFQCPYVAESKPCERACPWISDPESNGRVMRCPVFVRYFAEKLALKILKHSDIKDDRIKPLTDLKSNINNMSHVIERIREIDKRRSGVTLLISRPGTGKTHILSALLVESLQEGRSAFYLTAKVMKKVAEDMAGSNPGSESIEINNSLRAADVIFIDEIGREGAKTPTFENYLDPFLTGSRKVWIASNFFLDGNPDYSLKYNAATMSRLRWATVIMWEGVDYRTLKGGCK